jgi:acyl-CoA reductase-like NAD-dependent aldehyde dehydrogenase
MVVVPWKEEDEAIRMANESHDGLAAFIWTRDIGKAFRTAHAIDSGWIQINQGIGILPGQSYGGVNKMSGIG